MGKNVIEMATIVAIFCVMPSIQKAINSVTNVDLLIPYNSAKHNTAVFYATANRPESLIIRRSETFQIRMHFKTPFFPADRLQLHFVFIST
ncbi:hypothetical protein B4U80_14195 [Leptotrombidium deliense]|uniref:Transglutaminase N-terminal domain-containing protein n=1 Tax=Leptotrombidium deliense TaxID=299467 RepID=A0A443S0F7_9ACAR|nr:hypothetical protein B4U80_14195 [Leptotrombidium deliense]